MESYEEFCERSWARLQESGESTKTREPRRLPKPHSLIRFHRRAVLSPLLSAEQLSEMIELRQRAVQLETKRLEERRKKAWAPGPNLQGPARAAGEDGAKAAVASSSSYALVTDPPGPSGPSADRPAPPSSQRPLLNGVEAVNAESDEEEEEEEEDDDMSADSLLRRSRECATKAQRQRESGASPAPPPASDGEKKRPGAGAERGFSLQHRPVGPPPSPPQQHARLRPSEGSSSPRPQRRRPRPVSTGSIRIPFPIGPADLVPRSPGRSGTPEPPSELTGSEDAGGVGRSGSCFFIHGGANPEPKTLGPTGAAAFGPEERRDHLAPGFRRRCHTLDGQVPGSPSRAPQVDRGQERVPRFMAGVTWMPLSRRSAAAPAGRTCEAERPSPSPPRPHTSVPQLRDFRIEETQRTVRGLEDVHGRLEEEHGLQVSLLLAAQEKAQQRLHAETERRLMVRECLQQISAGGCGWICRSPSDGGHTVSPSRSGLCPARAPSEKAPGPRGFPSPVRSRVSPPSAQTPVFLLAPSWAVDKPRARLSLVLTPEQQRAFCRIGALIRGFLTRRLLRTEKVTHLCQTILDTQEFMRSFRSEAQNRDAYSAQDHSLQERVRAQLQAARYDVHDIFFLMPLGDRLTLLQQDRELRAERKLREMEKPKCPKERMILSSATQRSLDRRKRVGGSPAQSRKMQQKPKSPTTNRVKSCQDQTSPATGRLGQQGSWYKRTPERVRRSDSLKKQHSLG